MPTTPPLDIVATRHRCQETWHLVLAIPPDTEVAIRCIVAMSCRPMLQHSFVDDYAGARTARRECGSAASLVRARE